MEEANLYETYSKPTRNKPIKLWFEHFPVGLFQLLIGLCRVFVAGLLLPIFFRKKFKKFWQRRFENGYWFLHEFPVGLLVLTPFRFRKMRFPHTYFFCKGFVFSSMSSQPDIKDAYEFLHSAGNWTHQQVEMFVPTQYRERTDVIRHIANQDPRKVLPMYWLYQGGKFIHGYYCSKDVIEDAGIYCHRKAEFQFSSMPLEASIIEDIRFFFGDTGIHDYELQRRRTGF